VRWLRAAVLFAIAGAFAGCSLLALEPSKSPQPCADVYSAQTCLAITDEAASRSRRTRDDVTAIDIVQFPRRDEQGNVIVRSGGGFYARLTFTDGTTRDESMCVGVGGGPACMDTPKLEARSVLAGSGGYHDVPCADPPPPEGCGNPLPTLEPAAVKAAAPLRIDRVSIPIDHVGRYEVPLGKASVPNGVLSNVSFEFTDPWPLDVSLSQGVAWIEVRSLEPDGKPFQNYFDHGWRPGVERTEAVLAFEVLWFKKGAVLGIRDVLVQ
jgi:hypothetical protein